MRLKSATVLACAVALTAGLATPAAAAPTIVELPSPPGARFASAYDVNNAGVVVGTATNADYTTRGLRWGRDGQLSELPRLHPDDRSTSASAINNDGTIIGSSGSKTVQWNTDGSIRVLGPLPDHIGFSAAGINDSGTVYGNVMTNSGLGRAVRLPAHSTVFEELPPLPTRRNSYGHDMNRAGTVVGHSSDHAARWLADGSVEAFPAPPGHTSSAAVAIDVRGDALVMVTTDAAPGRTLYKWHANGTVTSVPAPSELYAQAMSDNGKIVGFYAVDMLESRGVTLADDGTTTDLGGLPGDTWTKGIRINETGDEIVGYSGAPGSRRAVVWRF